MKIQRISKTLLTEASTLKYEELQYLIHLLKPADISKPAAAITLSRPADIKSIPEIYVEMKAKIKTVPEVTTEMQTVQKYLNTYKNLKTLPMADFKKLQKYIFDLCIALDTAYGDLNNSQSAWYTVGEIENFTTKGLEIGRDGFGILLECASAEIETNQIADYKAAIEQSFELLKAALGWDTKMTGTSVLANKLDTARCLGIKDIQPYAILAELAVTGYNTLLNAFRTISPTTYATCKDQIINIKDKAYNFIQDAKKSYTNAFLKITELVESINKLLDWLKDNEAKLVAEREKADQEKEANKKAEDEIKNNDILLDSTKDWDALYNKAVENEQITAFYKQYFNTDGSGAWGKYGLYFQHLGEAFRLEVDEFGFSGANPFLIFLKRITNLCEKELKDSQDIILNNISKMYASIHNAYVYGYLSEDDLRGTGSLGVTNLIFSPDFYNTTGGSGKEYLEAQNAFIKNFNNQAWTAPAYSKKYSNILTALVRIFYETDSTKTVVGDPAKILNSNDLDNYKTADLVKIIRTSKLRNIRIITQLLYSAFRAKNIIKDYTKNKTKANLIDRFNSTDLKGFYNKLSPELKAEFKKLLKGE